jgi:hypothetical protein
MSDRKPYNEDAGYIASLRSGWNRGWVVIYEAKEQGIDVGTNRYAVVCRTHSRIIGVSSMLRIPAMPIANSNLMAIRIPIHADHHRSEATLDCTYHR